MSSFFFNVKILIFQIFRGLKGQKMARNGKNFCLWHLIFQEPYIIWSSFMGHMYNISRHFFSFFSKFWFLESLEGMVKGQKMAQNDKKVCLSHSVSQEPYIIWLWFGYTCVKWWYLQQIFSIFQILIFWGF